MGRGHGSHQCSSAPLRGGGATPQLSGLLGCYTFLKNPNQQSEILRSGFLRMRLHLLLFLCCRLASGCKSSPPARIAEEPSPLSSAGQGEEWGGRSGPEHLSNNSQGAVVRVSGVCTAVTACTAEIHAGLPTPRPPPHQLMIHTIAVVRQRCSLSRGLITGSPLIILSFKQDKAHYCFT